MKCLVWIANLLMQQAGARYWWGDGKIYFYVKSKSGDNITISLQQFSRGSIERVKVNVNLPYDQYNRDKLQQLSDDLELIIKANAVRPLDYKRIHKRFVSGSGKYPAKHTYHLEGEHLISGKVSQANSEAQIILADVQELCRVISQYF